MESQSKIIVSLIVATISIQILFVGCSHPLHIKNIDEFRARPPYLEEKIMIGVMPSSPDPISDQFVEYVVDKLNAIDNLKAIYPYTPALKTKVDYVVDLNVAVQYKGKGSNFFVAWPGFAVWAPAWHGYNYSADISTYVKILTPDLEDVLISKNYRTPYRCVQAEFDRTWIEIGWAEFTLCPLIGGIVFTRYDKDITQDFNHELSRPYGNYIARKIGTLIQSVKK